MGIKEKISSLSSQPQLPSQYWADRLSALSPWPELPLMVNPAGAGNPRLKHQQARIETKTLQTLEARAAQAGLTSASVLLAAFTEILSLWSKSQHFTLYLKLFDWQHLPEPSAGGAGDLPVVNLLEVENTEPGSFTERAQRLQAQLRQDLEHRSSVEVREMNEIIHMRSAGENSVIPVVYARALHRTEESSTEVPASGQTPYLTAAVHEDRNGLSLHWAAVEETFPAGLLDDMFSAYQSLLGQLATDESAWERTLADNAPHLLPENQMKLLAEVNRTRVPASEEFLHTLFLKQVELRPDQLAVCTPTRRMTYAEVYTPRLPCRRRIIAAWPGT